MYNVFIITRCIDLSCRKSATLVFNTIRVGFPTFKVICAYLGDFKEVEDEIIDKCAKNNIEFTTPRLETNNQVIEMLVNITNADFIVLDSDVVFHKNLEWYKPNKSLSGRYIPRQYESFLDVEVMDRLHTSLMYFTNIPEIREKIKSSFDQKCGGRFTPYNVFNPIILKHNGISIFYDSCCNLYHALGGEAFDSKVLECYDHLFCGSFYGEVQKEKPNLDKFFDSVFSDNKVIKGYYKKQNKYWYSTVFREIDIIFKERLSDEAQQFILSYVSYLEVIDDSIDNDDSSLVDIITEKALKLFSSNYWTKNSIYLRIIEQITHVIYFNSVEWEKSNVAWKRRDAKAMSHFGYLMPLAIFLLETKNLNLTRELALKLQERSHLAHMEDLTHEEHIA